MGALWISVAASIVATILVTVITLVARPVTRRLTRRLREHPEFLTELSALWRKGDTPEDHTVAALVKI